MEFSQIVQTTGAASGLLCLVLTLLSLKKKLKSMILSS